jgi:outer membrane protein assembly factor BamB
MARPPRLTSGLAAASIVIVSVSLADGGDALGAADWPQWRGPDRTAHADAAGIPEKLPPQLTKVWSIDVGEGHSSPVVAGDRVYQHARQGDDEVVLALDLATGRELWRRSFPTPYQMNPAAIPHGRGPKSTPVITGSRLCTLGIAGALACLDRESGKVLWRHSFEGRFPTTAPEFGTAMSPMVLDDLLIAHVGGVEQGNADGTWSVEEAWRNGDMSQYMTSPVLAGGVLFGLSPLQRGQLFALDATTGKTLWTSEGRIGENASLVLAGERLLVTTTDGVLFVGRASRAAWQPEARYEVAPSAVWAHTALVDGRILVKDRATLTLWRF